MIPYRDTVPCLYTPWVTWGLIFVNFAVFAFTEGLPDNALNQFLYLHGLIPARYTYPEWAAQVGFPPVTIALSSPVSSCMVAGCTSS